MNYAYFDGNRWVAELARDGMQGNLWLVSKISTGSGGMLSRKILEIFFPVKLFK